jgi:hypothetical protein
MSNTCTLRFLVWTKTTSVPVAAAGRKFRWFTGALKSPNKPMPVLQSNPPEENPRIADKGYPDV